MIGGLFVGMVTYMRQKIRNSKFKTKISFLFLLVLMLYGIVAGKLFYMYSYQDVLSNYYESSEDTVYQMNVHMQDRFLRISKSINALTNNMSFVNPMKVFLRNPSTLNYASLLGVVSDSITEIQMTEDYIHSIYIFTEYGDFDNFVRIKNHDSDFKQTALYQYFQDHPYETIAWFPAMESPIFVGSDIVIPVVYKLSLGQENIFIVVSLDQTRLIDYLVNTYSTYDKIFIVDENNNNIVNYVDRYADALYTDEQSEEFKEAAFCRKINITGKEYLSTNTVMKGNGWKIFALKTTESLTGNLKQLQVFILLELTVSAVLAIVLVVACVKTLTAPLRKLVEIMGTTIQQGFQVKFDYPYNDEVGYLAKNFNYMIQEIQDLIQELNLNIEALMEEKENVKRVLEQKRKADIMVLQAQINPHFLYNTLNTITLQSDDQGAKEISILSRSLGSFFRIALSKGREIITIKEELEHVKSYLEIQKIRYRSKVNYTIQVPEEMKGYCIVKILLQPLVENSIYHGIKTKAGSGQITITGTIKEQEGNEKVIEFCVEDNGAGIEENRLKILNQGLSKGIVDSENGYGIYNVNQRIKLYYGMNYGLRLESNPGVWTRAWLVLPIKEMDNNV